jgi:UDP-N-acetylglucosamine 2-epimerase/N-acetylmannosamine kinase
MNKLCFVIGNRAHYARVKPIIACLPKLSFRIILVEAAAITEYGDVYSEIKKDFSDSKICVLFTNVSGSNLVSMTKSTGMVISDLAIEFSREKPDVVVVIADRYEALASAIAARYMNIALAHIQGGENTGSIDDSIRHSITKLANLHFVSNSDCATRIIKMGEEPKNVYITGCSTMDLCREAVKSKKTSKSVFGSYHGIYEKKFEIKDRFIVVAFHSVTTEYADNKANFLTVLNAVNDLDMQVVWLYPNVDAGGDLIRKEILKFKLQDQKGNIHFFKHFPVEDYLILLKNAACVVGNSSIGIRETSFLGTPSVNIGSRQRGRTRSANVIDCALSKNEIKNSIRKQLNHGSYKHDDVYGDGFAGRKIAKILLNCSIDINKILSY